MALSRPALTLYALTGIYALIAAPSLLRQWDRQSAMLESLGGMTAVERARALDNPAVAVAESVSKGVPAEGCVAVLAYAGPAALDYYNARLDYLLYPRKVQVYADSSAMLESCTTFAIFRDTQQNLAAEPFQGKWDEGALAERIRGARRLGGDDLAPVYQAQ